MPKQKKKKLTQVKRRKMIEEVFKKGKQQREIAKKFDEKLSRKQGSGDKNKFQQLKRAVSNHCRALSQPLLQTIYLTNVLQL